MKSIRVRILFLMFCTLTSLIGLGNLSWVSFQSLENNIMQLKNSKDIVSLLHTLPSGKFDKNKMKLLQIYRKNLLELERQEALSQCIAAYSSFKGKTLIKLTKKFEQLESTYRLNYEKNIDKFRFQTKRNLILSFAVTFFFVAIMYIYTVKSIFKPLRKLSQKMIDFLNEKYTYKFETPEVTEVGNLHGTFNSLAEQVLQNMDELKALDRAKSEFLSIASHELRTPLTSIKGSLSLLKMSVDSDKIKQSKQLLSIAESETDRLIRLINDVLDLAKIEAGNFPLNPKWISIDELIEKAFAGLKGLCQTAKVQLVYNTFQNNIMIFADKDRLHQVLTNLLSNAIKYSPQDKPVVINIKITEHNHLKLEVQDYGKGISEDDQKLIFQKFSQASGPKNPLIKGTGLGLAIAKAMIEEHEGEIGVQSEINQGSIFYFTIPKWIHNEKKKINNLNLDSNLIKEAA